MNFLLMIWVSLLRTSRIPLLYHFSEMETPNTPVSQLLLQFSIVGISSSGPYSKHSISHSNAWDLRLDLKTLSILIFYLCFELCSWTWYYLWICSRNHLLVHYFAYKYGVSNVVLSFFLWYHEFLHRMWFYNLFD